MSGRRTPAPRTRVTRDDWLRVARDALVNEGVDQVKVAVLAERLQVARSSFYWYFTDRDHLTAALLDEWEAHNTSTIQERAGRPAATITEATLHVFECWADPQLFDVALEFAVRDWARRDQAVHARLATADESRIDALAAMHRRFGFGRKEALVRARVQYHSQIGLYALGVQETHEERRRLLPVYLQVFAGAEASPAELRQFARFVRTVGS
jgi:AcrR family transcriptional regulator